MNFTNRQKAIIQMLKENSPLTGETIADRLNLAVPTIRGDLRLLTAVGELTAKPKVGYMYSGQQMAKLQYHDLYETQIANILLPATEIQADTTLQEAVSKLFLQDVGSLYVVDNKHHLQGLISRKDLLRASLNNADSDAMLASMIMTRMPNVITVTPQTSIIHVGNLLLTHKVDSLPVVNPDDQTQVVGKITKNRIFQRFMEIGNEVNR
ncbi:helix-turn-helix transcriptional regulator [Furfurilactobacillus curtus]|uniref:CBS domain-containing protein n=1 Tax=Furfurilactobacillus curtus TaxID=1746200 RepID=A0ABQ5JMZ8_9LACO